MATHRELPIEVRMEGFDFTRYKDSERFLLKPQLEKLGWWVVWFTDGERDSHGPLSRVVRCRKGNESVDFIYG